MYKADVHRNLIKVMINAFEPNEEDEKLLRSAELALKGKTDIGRRADSKKYLNSLACDARSSW